MDKLMQMLSNSMEKQQQQQQQQNENNNDNNNDDVMRFFRNITPPPSLNNSLNTTVPLTTNTTSPTNNNNNSNYSGTTKSLFEVSLPSKIHMGVYLYGKQCVVDSHQFSLVSREIESQTLTIINNNKKDHYLGNCITTNTNYICYIIKGKVRILDGTSSNKALIKNEFKEANDVQFHQDESNYLSVCSSPESSCFVYQINKSTDGSIEPFLLATIQSPSKVPFSYVSWHPLNIGLLAICPSIDNSEPLPIYLFNIYSHRPSDPILKIMPPSRETFYGQSFSCDGSLLAVCTHEGTVCVYNTSNLTASSSGSSQLFDTELLYCKRFTGKRLRTVQFITGSKDVLLLTTTDSEVLVVKLDPGFETLQSISFRPPLTQEFNLVSFKDQFLFMADSKEHKCYCLHYNSHTQSFDYITNFDFKTPVFSFTLKTLPYDQSNGSGSGSSQSPLNPLANSDPRGKKHFYIYTFQSNAIYRFRLGLSDDYLTTDQYHIDSSIVVQNNNLIDNDSQDSDDELSILKYLVPNPPTSTTTTTTNENNEQKQKGENSEDVDNVLLTPKSFSQHLNLTSPPPVSLPDPDLLNNNNNNNNSHTGEKKTKKTKKAKKDDISTPTPTSPTPTSSPNISVEDSILTAMELKKKLASPNSSNITTTNPTVLTKSKSNQSLSGSSTPNTPTSPQQPLAKPKAKEKSSNVTPSFIPPPLQIPTSNPLHVSKTTKSSSTNTSSTNLNNTPPHSNNTSSTIPTTTNPTNLISPSNLSPPTSSTSSSSSNISLPDNIHSMFKEMENHLFNRFEKVLDRERLEREAQEKERQEKLVQSIQASMKSNIEKIVKKEVSTLMTGLEKSIQTSIEASVTKSTGEYLKKITAKATETLTQSLKASITSESFDNQIKAHMETVFLTYFKSTLIPGFEKSCKEMFKHLSVVYQKGFNENMQQQNLAIQSLHIAIQQTVANEFKTIKDQNSNTFNQFVKDREVLINDVKAISQQSQQFIQQTSNVIQQQQHQQNQMQLQHQQQHQQSNHNTMYSSPISQRTMPLSNSSGMPELPFMGMMPIPIPIPSPSPQHSQTLPIPHHQQQQQQQQQSPLQPYPALKAFIDKGDFVNALNFSLNASNLQMVVAVCQVLDPLTVLSKQPMPANTLLSLIQQLSIDIPNLSADTEVRLRWIRESLSAFDMNSCGRPDVAKKIFNTLKSKLEQPQLQSSFPHYVNSIKQLLNPHMN